MLTATRWAWRALAAVGVVGLLVISVLAWPMAAWRTGEIPSPALSYLPQALPTTVETTVAATVAATEPAAVGRVWIDADAACGTGPRRDPDDCLALLSLSFAKGLTVVGISTVFGNAPLAETDAVMRALVQEIGPRGGQLWPVFRGCGAVAQGCLNHGGSRAAQDGLAAALQAGAMDVLALGPLTNIAAVLTRDPTLARRVTRVIAVMGRRPGHRFHPSENRGVGAMLFGHGPIFRDLNAVLDPQAVAVILGSGVPLILVPYTAAQQVLMTASDLDALTGLGPAGRWVAERSRPWLEFWRSEAGLEGFYPFDLLAVAYLRGTSHFRCARVSAWVGDDALLPWFGGGPALLVAQANGVQTPPSGASAALYCDVLSHHRTDDLFR